MYEKYIEQLLIEAKIRNLVLPVLLNTMQTV